MTTKLRPITLLLVTAAISGTAQAQAVSYVDQSVDATCAVFVKKMLEGKDFVQLGIERPISSQAVCSCARERAHEDPRLSQLSSVSNERAIVMLRDPKVYAYTSGRIVQAVMACFNRELDTTLNASSALK